MILPLWLLSIVLGVVEGLTEFLPISSTGHLILVSHLFGFTGDRAEVFEIFIQIGAVIAVVVEYRNKLIEVIQTAEWTFFANLLIAFLPAAVLGLAVHHWISEHLFGPRTVAAALIVGAIAIILVERMRKNPQVQTVDDVGPVRAGLIGIAQCISLWPGFSRSAATILGGLMCGLERKAATEFSFFLAIPTLGAATLYDLYKKHDLLVPGDMTWLLLATVVSFLVAWASIRWLIRFVATHDLTPFAWYRIALGLVVLFL
jgi:undecaprenyl-diphosphatase